MSEKGLIDEILGNKENNELRNDKDKLAFLKSPDLMERINKELDKKIVKEYDSRKAIFLCSAGRLVKNCNLASYNLLVNSESGSGKDWVTEKTLKIWPERNSNGEDILIKRTRITENVFTYWHNPKFEPEWTWNGKVFYNEDISNSVLNSDVFKVMASSGSKATVLVKQTPIDIDINGKPVIIVTTASANPSKEILRRFTLLNLDESVDQTKEIMKRQAKLAVNGISQEYDPGIQEALKLLIRLEVKIPFAEKLTDYFPTDHVIMRTHFNRFLDYIKASACLHQWQRKRDMVNKATWATGEDYDIARDALLKTTSNQQMIPLTKNQQRIMEIMKDQGDEWYSVSDLEPKVTFISDRMLRTELNKLTEFSFLYKTKETREDSNKPVMVYRHKRFAKIDIPRWEEIKDAM